MHDVSHGRSLVGGPAARACNNPLCSTDGRSRTHPDQAELGQVVCDGVGMVEHHEVDDGQPGTNSLSGPAVTRLGHYEQVESDAAFSKVLLAVHVNAACGVHVGAVAQLLRDVDEAIGLSQLLDSGEHSDDRLHRRGVRGSRRPRRLSRWLDVMPRDVGRDRVS